MATEIVVDGAAELARAFKLLGDEAKKTALMGAIGPGALDVLAAMKVKVPRRSGKLADSLKLIFGERTTDHGDILVGSWKEMTASGKRGVKDDPYWRAFVELGTAHNPAHPYMRPALDERKDMVVAKATDYLRRLLLKVGLPL